MGAHGNQPCGPRCTGSAGCLPRCLDPVQGVHDHGRRIAQLRLDTGGLLQHQDGGPVADHKVAPVVDGSGADQTDLRVGQGGARIPDIPFPGRQAGLIKRDQGPATDAAVPPGTRTAVVLRAIRPSERDRSVWARTRSRSHPL